MHRVDPCTEAQLFISSAVLLTGRRTYAVVECADMSISNSAFGLRPTKLKATSSPPPTSADCGYGGQVGV